MGNGDDEPDGPAHPLDEAPPTAIDDEANQASFEAEEGHAHEFELNDGHSDDAEVDEEPEEESEFYCEDEGRIVVHDDLQQAVEDARDLIGVEDAISVEGGVCPTAPDLCPAEFRRFHQNGDALHITDLDDRSLRGDDTRAGAMVRIAELAGLWGLDLSHVTGRAARRMVRKSLHHGTGAVGEVYPPAATWEAPDTPWANVSVVPIREGTHRHIHLHRGASIDRVVCSYVDGHKWRNLGYEVEDHGPSIYGYRLHKSTVWQASLHREWGMEHTIAWLMGLAAFYRSQVGQPLGIGDLSHVVGEDQTDHASHEFGVDVDLYVLDVGREDPGGRGWREAYVVDTASPVADGLEFRRMVPPAHEQSAAEPAPVYGTRPPASRRVTDPDQHRAIFDAYATIFAYLMVTHPQIELAIWYQVNNRAILERALEIARAAFNEEGEGEERRHHWRPEWGLYAPWANQPSPPNPWVAQRADQIGRFGGHLPRDDHKDHVHVRVRNRPRSH